MKTRANYLIFGILCMAMLVGCAKNATPHPNQLSDFDGKVYDRLVEAQAALDEAKVQFAAGTIPATSKGAINEAGALYDSTRLTWLLYREILQGKQVGNPEEQRQRLNAEMLQLAQAIVNLQKLSGGR